MLRFNHFLAHFRRGTLSENFTPRGQLWELGPRRTKGGNVTTFTPIWIFNKWEKRIRGNGPIISQSTPRHVSKGSPLDSTLSEDFRRECLNENRLTTPPEYTSRRRLVGHPQGNFLGHPRNLFQSYERVGGSGRAVAPCNESSSRNMAMLWPAKQLKLHQD